ncbi:MAG: hypothetical protein QM784_17760 [Polyangiaceae bacterium]
MVDSRSIGAHHVNLTPRRLRCAAVIAALLHCSCVTSTPQTHRFYVGAQRPPTTVARLSGYVRYIDGVDVSKLSGQFELLPGCHVVHTPPHWSRGDSTGAVVANTGVIPFAIPMRPHHSYVIVVDGATPTGPMSRFVIRAEERDSRGMLTSTFGPTRDESELYRCEQLANAYSDTREAQQ